MNESVNSDYISQLKKLGELREQGILSEEEFQAEKRRLLGAGAEEQQSVPSLPDNDRLTPESPGGFSPAHVNQRKTGSPPSISKRSLIDRFTSKRSRRISILAAVAAIATVAITANLLPKKDADPATKALDTAVKKAREIIDTAAALNPEDADWQERASDLGDDLTEIGREMFESTQNAATDQVLADYILPSCTRFFKNYYTYFVDDSFYGGGISGPERPSYDQEIKDRNLYYLLYSKSIFGIEIDISWRMRFIEDPEEFSSQCEASGRALYVESCSASANEVAASKAPGPNERPIGYGKCASGKMKIAGNYKCSLIGMIDGDEPRTAVLTLSEYDGIFETDEWCADRLDRRLDLGELKGKEIEFYGILVGSAEENVGTRWQGEERAKYLRDVGKYFSGFSAITPETPVFYLVDYKSEQD